MKALGLALAGCLVLGLTAIGQADDKKEPTNKEKIVGIWEPTKGELPKGSTVEFTKDGKLKVVVKIEDKSITLEGTYTVDGDKVKTVLKDEGQERKEDLKIKTLNDKELVLVDDKGMAEEFKRKK